MLVLSSSQLFYCVFVFQQTMKTIFVWGCLMAAIFAPCSSDVYLHFPPGSNNRLNGNQDNVRNANRLFDSQVRLQLHTFCKIQCLVSFRGIQNKRNTPPQLNSWPNPGSLPRSSPFYSVNATCQRKT